MCVFVSLLCSFSAELQVKQLISIYKQVKHLLRKMCVYKKSVNVIVYKNAKERTLGILLYLKIMSQYQAFDDAWLSVFNAYVSLLDITS